MFQDPIIEELRKIRSEIEKEYKNDPEQYYRHLLEFQKNLLGDLVRRKPKPTIRKKLRSGQKGRIFYAIQRGRHAKTV